MKNTESESESRGHHSLLCDLSQEALLEMNYKVFISFSMMDDVDDFGGNIFRGGGGIGTFSVEGQGQKIVNGR